MIYPKHLESGHKIGVTATSAGFESEVDMIRLESATNHFQKRGYPVIETDNVRRCVKGRSSDGQARAAQLTQLFTDPEIGVVIAASGGDYLFEMLPYLDYDRLAAHPKWFQGFSDNTGLTYTLTTIADMATIYSNNFSSFGMVPWHHSLEENMKLLEGKDILQYSFDKYQDGYRERITGYEGFEPDREVLWKNLYPSKDKNQEVIHLMGRAIGGCLDVLLNLVGTRYDKTRDFIEKYHKDGILWYLESFDLGSEGLTRGLWQLKEAGWFSHACGFVFGRPAMYRTYSDTSYEEALLSVLGEFDLPIIMDADIGHKQPQFTMINGAIAHVDSKDGTGSIYFERR